MKQNNEKISAETKQESLKIAKATQRAGQTKEQTKLIARGIEKGIQEYKKRHKNKVRDLNREKKKVHTKLSSLNHEENTEFEQKNVNPNQWKQRFYLLLAGSTFLVSFLSLRLLGIL